MSKKRRSDSPSMSDLFGEDVVSDYGSDYHYITDVIADKQKSIKEKKEEKSLPKRNWFTRLFGR